ncbi:MAG: hypothetical protein ABJA02_14845 [Acidobacteriota bacterium]
MMDAKIWTEYETRARLRDGDNMAVSLWSSGVFRLNDSAIRAMGEPDAVRLFFNRAERALALVPAEVGARNAVPFRRLDGNEGRVLSALGFCRQFGILPEKAMAFDSPSISPDGAMTLHLGPE